MQSLKASLGVVINEVCMEVEGWSKQPQTMERPTNSLQVLVKFLRTMMEPLNQNDDKAVNISQWTLTKEKEYIPLQL